jgi:2-keto-myo-inositol isomerase
MPNEGQKTVTEIQFALNRTCLPHGTLDEFISLAKSAGVSAVEIRNDIAGREFSDGTPAREIKARLDNAGLKVASVNALQRFNDWTNDREAEAKSLIRYAAEIGAPGLVLCPAHEPRDGWDEKTKDVKLREGLRKLKPVFEDEGVIGYVEPLGMFHSTMKNQSRAVAAIDDVGGGACFALCYDTFQYFRCADDSLFLNRVALIHVSGISRTDLAPGELTEPDRGLVFADDRVGNIEKLRWAAAEGYSGFVSIEPFNPETQRDPQLPSKLRRSIDIIRSAM